MAGFHFTPDKITPYMPWYMYMHKHLVQIYKCAKRRHVHSTNEAASVVVFPYVQCELVASLAIDGSPDSVSPLVVLGLMVLQVGS